MAQPPPPPGSFVQPNFLPVVDAMGAVPFPISKRELLEQVGDETCVFDGRNVALHDLIKDIHDDYFDSEDELLAALETAYVPSDEAAFPSLEPEGANSLRDPLDRASPMEENRDKKNVQGNKNIEEQGREGQQGSRQQGGQQQGGQQQGGQQQGGQRSYTGGSQQNLGGGERQGGMSGQQRPGQNVQGGKENLNKQQGQQGSFGKTEETEEE